MTKKKMSNKMKMVKDPKTGKMVPEFAVKKAAGKMVKKKMMAGGKMVKKMMSDGKLVGGQKKLDKDNDGKISGKDFAMLRGGKAKGGAIKKMAGGKMVKKMMSGGGKAKGMANGGKKKSKPKVRGAGKAIKGVRPAKMR